MAREVTSESNENWLRGKNATIEVVPQFVRGLTPITSLKVRRLAGVHGLKVSGSRDQFLYATSRTFVAMDIPCTAGWITIKVSNATGYAQVRIADADNSVAAEALAAIARDLGADEATNASPRLRLTRAIFAA